MSRKSARSSHDLADIVIRGKTYTDRGYCYEAGYDGPVIHTVYCRWTGGRWTAMSGHDCIRSNQDGARIAEEREVAEDRRRFTPPEYRERPVEPGPVITVARTQPVRVLALRGRPKAPGAEWSTWETYQDQGDGTFWGDVERIANGPKPAAMTADEARAIVTEFSARVPTHEFKVVLARLTLTEEQIA
jgi:hypothetical protein